MINIDFNMPPIDNIAFLAAKNKELHFDYDEIMHEAHLKTFTVAKVTKIDLLNDIQESLLKAQTNGQSFSKWRKEIKPTLQAAGWLGKIIVTNPDTEEQKEIYVGSRRLKNIFYTNMRTSYNQARAREQYLLPNSEYLRYVCIDDNRVRQSHKSLHGLILHRNSQFWKTCYPPNDWNCRCRVQAYSKEQIERKGWSIAKDPPAFTPHKDWSYDTRNLKNSDNELQHIINKKLQEYTNNESVTQSLNNILQEIESRNKRFRNIKELWESKDLSKTTNICKTPPLLKSIFNTDAEHVYISANMIIEHKTRHPEIDSFDYSLIADMLDNIYGIYQDEKSNVKYVIASKLGRWYRLGLKSLSDKKEIWVESLVSIGDKEVFLKKLKNKKMIYKKDE